MKYIFCRRNNSLEQCSSTFLSFTNNVFLSTWIDSSRQSANKLLKSSRGKTNILRDTFSFIWRLCEAKNEISCKIYTFHWLYLFAQNEVENRLVPEKQEAKIQMKYSLHIAVILMRMCVKIYRNDVFTWEKRRVKERWVRSTALWQWWIKWARRRRQDTGEWLRMREAGAHDEEKRRGKETVREERREKGICTCEECGGDRRFFRYCLERKDRREVTTLSRRY